MTRSKNNGPPIPVRKTEIAAQNNSSKLDNSGNLSNAQLANKSANNAVSEVLIGSN